MEKVFVLVCFAPDGNKLIGKAFADEVEAQKRSKELDQLAFDNNFEFFYSYETVYVDLS